MRIPALTLQVVSHFHGENEKNSVNDELVWSLLKLSIGYYFNILK